MNEIVLAGCTPTPLASYLKALGVLRLLSTVHPETKGAWRGEHFFVVSSLDEASLEQFFLQRYRPTTVVAPWNAGSGFYFQERKSNERDPTTGKRIKLGVRDQPTSATRVVSAILGTTNERFAEYRAVIQLCREHVRRLGFQEAPEDVEKERLCRLLRGILPDCCLDWIDAALVISGERSRFPPLLGSGGNDGNLDFSSNFMQRLLDVLGPGNEAPAESITWLRSSLFNQVSPSLTRDTVGQFSPGQVGGPNATNGFEGDSIMNPWDFVLALEGALAFAAAAVRRNADDPDGVLSFPFTVRAVGAGAGSLGEGDVAAARGELWVPLWGSAATYPEIRTLLSEGRVALGRKPVRDALDFVRAAHRLGSYRGISGYQRYGLLRRSGKAYLATPLARVEVTQNPKTEWLDDLEHNEWLSRFRRFAQGESVARRFLVFRKRLEDLLFDISGRAPSPAEVQTLLVLLGSIQKTLSISRKAQEFITPVPRLSESWVQAADDGTAAFRIARALAGLSGVGDIALPLRAQLFPVHPIHNLWMTPKYKGEHADHDVACRVHIWTDTKGRLEDVLVALLGRRLWLAEQFEMPDKPLRGPAGVDLRDLVVFLRSDYMDHRILALLPGLSLCNVPKDADPTAGEGTVPAAFALLKLCLTPDATLRALSWLGEEDHVRLPQGLLAQLSSGNVGNRAIQTAWRHLRTSGLLPLVAHDALPALSDMPPRRVGAALLIPLRFGATGSLCRSVLRTREAA